MTDKQNLVCGLDLSTSVCGWSRMSESGELLNYGFYKFDKPDGYTNLDLVNQWDEHVWPKIKDASTVVLEDSLKRYQGGFSSRKTITKLLQFNAVVRYELRKRKGKDSVIKIHPSTAKKESFLNRGRVPSNYKSPWSTYKDSKAWAIEEAKKQFDSYDYELTHAGNPRPGSADCADSIILASAFVGNN
jgi:hypothetical protein